MSATAKRKMLGAKYGFSLIELVIVVAIIAIIAAIAIPRSSRGSASAADSTLSESLAVLRNAIDLYATEHGGSYPAVATFDAQLTRFTDARGTPSGTKTAIVIYGPYLRKMPPLPVGANRNNASVIDGSTGAAGAASGGWFYNPSTGDIRANCPDTDVDATGKKYNSY